MRLMCRATDRNRVRIVAAYGVIVDGYRVVAGNGHDAGTVNAKTSLSRTARDANGSSMVRLRTICRKSTHLSLRIVVRPRVAEPST